MTQAAFELQRTETNYADGQNFVIGKGESIRFKADTVHSYKNVGNESAELHMILFNP